MTDAWRPPGGEILHAGLRVRRLRGEGATFVLLHGLAGSGRYFGAAFDALADAGCVVAPDLLGFGGSPRPPTAQYDGREHAAAVREALESLDVRRPIVAVGHSAGALVALRLAADWPDAVRGVVAFSPPIYRDATEARRRIARLSLYVRLLAMDGPLARAICRWHCRHPTAARRLFQMMRPDLPPEIAGDATLHTWESYSGTLRHLIFAADARHHLERTAAPLLLVAGDRDRTMDRDLLAEIARDRSSARLEIWAGAHDLPLSSAEASVSAVRDFARRVERAERRRKRSEPAVVHAP
jgi:pimeloyl-ACP methyl ester carboxylesterase